MRESGQRASRCFTTKLEFSQIGAAALFITNCIPLSQHALTYMIKSHEGTMGKRHRGAVGNATDQGAKRVALLVPDVPSGFRPTPLITPLAHFSPHVSSGALAPTCITTLTMPASRTTTGYMPVRPQLPAADYS